MTTQPRRWFPRSFGLRTLLIAVTVFGVWLGWERHVVHERASLIDLLAQASRPQDFNSHSLEDLESIGMFEPGELSEFDYVTVSPVRRLFGDKSYIELQLPPTIEANLLEQIEYAFPEAVLRINVPTDDTTYLYFRDSLSKPQHLREKNYGSMFTTGLKD